MEDNKKSTPVAGYVMAVSGFIMAVASLFLEGKNRSGGIVIGIIFLCIGIYLTMSASARKKL